MTSTPTREAALLVNTKSRMGREWYDSAVEKLSAAGIKLTSKESFTDPKRLVARAKELVNDVPLLITGGGDGTLSGVANVLAKSQTALAVLPFGTGNAFARDLGIPVDVEKAVEIVAEGHQASVDLGVHEGGYFVNVATIGLTTQIAESLTAPMKRKFGRFVYAVAVFRALEDLKPFHVKLDTEHGVTEAEALQVVIGNGHYHAGPFPLAASAKLTSGKEHVYVVEGKSKAALLRYALMLPSGRLGILNEIHAEDTVGGRVETTPNIPVIVDGEVCQDTPMRFSVAPKALRVIVPKSFEG